jgi:hypothetical protein
MHALDTVMLISIGLIELFRLINVTSNAHATLVARDPIPVAPVRGTKVAFITTFVPGKERVGAGAVAPAAGFLSPFGCPRTASGNTRSPRVDGHKTPSTRGLRAGLVTRAC